VSFRIQPSIDSQLRLKAAVEANKLTAPGPPGAVDKGEEQVRGEKLSLTAGPASRARLVQQLTIVDR
jgi:hypothetical protein